MKIKILILAITFFVALLSAQQPVPNSNSGKGTSPLISHSSDQRSSSTYAVVIGISDYQDPGIPDLRFADKDAEAFANYLRSNAGGKLDGDHLQILTNNRATAGRVAEAFDALIEKAKKDDQVIIYFSGHGDVEGKKLSQPGFLLCWDSPSRVYMGGGTYSLSFLQEVVSTLSLQNQAKVTVITDACHAGKLAGNQIGGSQLTTANLAKQFGNEIKILSCQPNEFSIEGEQWGGGRGVFSFHLIDALYGLADNNNDQFVTLQEVGRYLEDHVTNEVAPISQVPMIIGNRNERLTSVDENVLASIKSGKTNQTMMLSAIESRGIEEDVLSKVDSNTRKIYGLFKSALKDKFFLEPVNACADTYFAQLINEPKMNRLHLSMRRNYAAALQDDAQQVMNKFLKTDVNELLLSKRIKTEKYKSFPVYLERAAELLGDKHYIYRSLMARKLFFEGFLLAMGNPNPDSKLGARAIAKLNEALQLEHDLPQAYWQISAVWAFNFQKADSMEYYAEKAIALQPTWLAPYELLSNQYVLIFHNYNKARYFLEKAALIDSNNSAIINVWANYYSQQNQKEKAEEVIKKGISLDSTYLYFYTHLGITYSAEHPPRFEESEIYIRKALQIDSTHTWTWNALGTLFLKTKRYDEAEVAYKKAISSDSTESSSWMHLGLVYTNKKEFANAEMFFKKAISIDSTKAPTWINLAGLYSGSNRLNEALPILKKAITLDSTNGRCWAALGLCHQRLKQYADAENALNKSISLDSTWFWTWSNLGNLYSDTKRYPEAEYALKKAISLNPKWENCWTSLSNVYLNTKRLGEAKTAALKAIELDSTQVWAHNNLGVTYYNLKLYSDAEKQFRKVIQLDSNNINGQFNLGNALKELAQYDEAEQQYRKAIQLDSNRANIYYQFGLLYFVTKKFEESEKQTRKAIQKDPSNAYAYQLLACLQGRQNNLENAFESLELAIKNGLTDYNALLEDQDLNPLKVRKEQWDALMKKYFPEKSK